MVIAALCGLLVLSIVIIVIAVVNMRKSSRPVKHRSTWKD